MRQGKMATSQVDWGQDSELEEGEIKEDCEERQPGDGTIDDGTPGKPSHGPRTGLEPQLSGGKTIDYHGGAPLLPWQVWTGNQRATWWKAYKPKSKRERGQWLIEWLAKMRARYRLSRRQAREENILPPAEVRHRSPVERPATQHPALPNGLSAVEQLQSVGGILATP
jgi:hypothetical protein